MKNKKILIGVCGGIAAYKVCSLVNLFKKEGATVKVMMTKAATNFVALLTFQSLTENLVYQDMFDLIEEGEIEHISLAKWADVIVLAPATANTIGKIALGIADNLVTTTIIALPRETPVIVAPAMNTNMWQNPIVQKNIKLLEGIKREKGSDKYIVVGPGKGKLACGDEGEGVLIDLKQIIKTTKEVLKK
jgi:phosphopantothenoylcysteine decarboxylase/phosphopantothenate--cysteine ligase